MQSKSKILTHGQLIAMINSTNGALPVGLLSETDSKAKKTGNPYGRILKRSRSVGWIGVNYQASVEREAARQGNSVCFDADPLPWGNWLIPNKVISHKGEFYLRTQSTPGGRKRQPAKVLGFRSEATGQFLSYETVKPFLPPVRESNKQAEEAGLEGSENQIKVRTYKFDSIQKIRIGGVTYTLINEFKAIDIPMKNSDMVTA
jgi:hypothetical protein